MEQDEHEDGLRAILNFGHTVGHALEALTEYRTYTHGEAIALGMVSAALIGEEVGITRAADTESMTALLRAAGFAVRLDRHTHQTRSCAFWPGTKKALAAPPASC